MFEAITNFDLSVLNGIQNIFKCEFLDFLMPAVSLFGEYGAFWIAVAVIMLCFKKTRKAGWVIGSALLIGVLLGNAFLKPYVARIRPYDLPGNEIFRANLLVPPLSDFSFPSGHSLACFEGAVGMMFYSKKLGIPALVIAFLVAFSRLYLYVHYLSDVVVGALLGTAFAFLAKFIVGKIDELIDKKKEITQ